MDYWLTLAKKQPEGGKARFQHDCGEGKAAIASHGPDGYSGYCFRCGKLGFVPHGKRTLEDLRRLRELNNAARKPLPPELPDDYTTSHMDDSGRRWLAAAGLSPARCRALGIGWSPSMRRVILPVSAGYYQARAVEAGQLPKYINPNSADAPIFEYLSPDDACREAGVVVTEDILSACRVGKHMFAASALGTKLSDAGAVRLRELAEEGPIYIWLDPDKAGQDGAATMRRQLSLLSDSVHIIESRLDPKLLSDREIRELLSLPPNHRYEYYV